MTDTTIQTDVDHGSDDGANFDAASAFSALLDDEGTPSKKREDGEHSASGTAPEGPASSVDEHKPDDEGTEGNPDDNAQTDPKDDQGAAPAAREATDDDEVTIQVGDEARKVPVKDLKRLFGQEASLTRKSQEVAEARRVVDAEVQKYTAGLQTMTDAAKARWNEYAKIDWVDARASLTPEHYQQLRDDAGKAFQEAQYFEQTLGAQVQQQREAQFANMRERVVETVKELKDPERGIPGWSDVLYNEVRSHAIDVLGAPREVINNLVDPWAIKALHAAMQFAKGQAALKQATPTPKPTVPAGSQRAATSNQAPERVNPRAASVKDVLARQRASGSMDDTADAFSALL